MTILGGVYDTLYGGTGNDVLFGVSGYNEAVFDYSSATADLTLNATDVAFMETKCRWHIGLLAQVQRNDTFSTFCGRYKCGW